MSKTNIRMKAAMCEIICNYNFIIVMTSNYIFNPMQVFEFYSILNVNQKQIIMKKQ